MIELAGLESEHSEWVPLESPDAETFPEFQSNK